MLERRLVRGRDPDLRSRRSHVTQPCDALLPFVFGCQSASDVANGTAPPGLEFPGKSGGADRSRTDDIQLAKLALYQLSYSPTSARRRNWWA